MNFIGIDLAWTYRKETGICVIDDNGNVLFCESQKYSDEMLAGLVKHYSAQGAVVAIDAPLVVANETGSRACDRNLMKEKIHGRNLSLFNCSREYLQRTYGAIRGEEVVRSIQELTPEFVLTTIPKDRSHSIIEVFPSSIVLGLFSDAFPVKYKHKSSVELYNSKNEMTRLLGLINHLSEYDPPVFNASDYFSPYKVEGFTTKSAFKSFEDQVDAFLCAYAAYWHSKKEGKIFGDEKTGFILVPVEKTVRTSGDKGLSTSTYKLHSSTQVQNQSEPKPKHTVDRSSDLTEMLEAIKQFRIQNGLEVGTNSQETMFYRMNLMMEELGEISQCLTKGKGNLAEEHADLLILLLGNCLTMDLDIVNGFWDKYQVIMNRTSKKIGLYERVSSWEEAEGCKQEI
ncbi:DUF429 domain-containing protein [Desulfitobacterium sp. THU1]|uniref:DUF429 domain-containing protein n=1 Tax=Desulfitobacterium sp. THU1 TaxID=3138072 RepID=UPI00311F0177